MSKLKLKVCGMKNAENIKQLVKQQPDFMGFIFYAKSPRFVSEPDEDLFSRIPISIKKVGVFVNESLETILRLREKLGLDYVQLHGDEDLSFSKSLKKNGVGIIKVFRLLDSLPYSLPKYSGFSDYFLFDTSTPEYGGSGRHFDWSILKSYNLETPFLLSGGITEGDIEEIKSMRLEKLVGIDVNSKFEVSPGMKNINMLRQLKERI
ncbi:MAG: phosphoribosylanthranilate isomerase [Cyclobacteriaceae bacterium]